MLYTGTNLNKLITNGTSGVARLLFQVGLPFSSLTPPFIFSLLPFPFSGALPLKSS